MRKIFIFLSLSLFAFSPSFVDASHNLGGELSYRCVGGGQYVFRLVYYKDCTGIPVGTSNVRVTADNLIGSISGAGVSGNQIQMNLISSSDISPTCKYIASGPDSIYCSAGINGNGSIRGSASQFVFESAPVDFNGVSPPASGSPYLFYYVFPPARNRNGNLGGCGTICLRAFMFRYEVNGIPIPPALLCDNSPVFGEPPTSLQVVNPSDTAVFNNNAFDFDLDSLAYAIDYPWTGKSTPCAYNRGFSLINPFPGILFAGPGQAINPVTGVIEFRPQLVNNYVACIRVESWRCGQKIAEVYRDFQLQVLPLPTNYPRVGAMASQQTRPDVTKPFPDPVTLKPGESYEACYFVGDTVEFEMTAIDLDFFPSTKSKTILQWARL